ncbi:MAG: DUF2017 family protein [Verrucomicrobiia bacterium]
MNRLRVRAIDEKHICISGIPLLLVFCLRELPHILEKRDTPDARARLFPAPTRDDAKANQDWEQLMAPELRHLFVTAGETVARDLSRSRGIEEESAKSHSCRITFAAAHLNAWMSAINEARLILGEIFDVTEQDMNQEDLDLDNPKQFAVLKIGALGWLLGHLIAFATGESDADDEPTTDETDGTR